MTWYILLAGILAAFADPPVPSCELRINTDQGVTIEYRPGKRGVLAGPDVVLELDGECQHKVVRIGAETPSVRLTFEEGVLGTYDRGDYIFGLPAGEGRWVTVEAREATAEFVMVR